MRRSTSFCTVVLLSALAAGRVTVTSGYAGYWTPPPGIYSTPFVPLLTTPSVDLGSPSLQVSSSNATAGNIAGATNGTLSTDTSGPGARFAQPIWNGQAVSTEPEEKTGAAEAEASQIEHRFDFGVATFQSNYGVARLANRQKFQEPAKHVYTNDDIVRLDEATGMVKVGGKMERLE